VDRVLGHREIVVRGIGDQLVQVPGIAGATDLGDERSFSFSMCPPCGRQLAKTAGGRPAAGDAMTKPVVAELTFF
jgi:hypothetical protein